MCQLPFLVKLPYHMKGLCRPIYCFGDATIHTCTLVQLTNLQLSFWESAEPRWVSNRQQRTKRFSSAHRRSCYRVLPAPSEYIHTEIEGTEEEFGEALGRIIPCRGRSLSIRRRGRRGFRGGGWHCVFVRVYTRLWSMVLESILYRVHKKAFNSHWAIWIRAWRGL